MRKLINIIICTIFSIFVIGCCAQKKNTTNEVLGASMKYSLYIEKGSSYQVDSLISADTLPVVNRWIGGTFVDYNTNNRITKRTFIKQFSGSEIVYVITGNVEPFKIEKRIIEK